MYVDVMPRCGQIWGVGGGPHGAIHVIEYILTKKFYVEVGMSQGTLLPIFQEPKPQFL